MEKKPHVPPPAATKAPAAPAKQATPPQAEPPAKGPAGAQKNPDAATPVPGEQGTDLSEVPAQSADKKPDTKPSDTPAAAVAPGLDIRKQVRVPADPIDWMAMRQPFLDHNVPLTERDGDQIRQNWTMSYRTLLPLMGPDLSGKIANLGTAFAYDKELARDNPNQLEKFDMETEKALGRARSWARSWCPCSHPTP